MIDKLIIGITGHKQSGKDTVASFLEPLLSKSRRTFTYHIGNEIAKYLAQITGGNPDKIRSIKNDPYMRGILQFLAEARRLAEGSDIFIKDLERAVDEVIIKCFVLVPSIRFLKEYNWIKARHGLIIRVFRPEADEVEDPHPTESEVRHIPFDFSVINDANTGRLEFYCKNLAADILNYANSDIRTTEPADKATS